MIIENNIVKFICKLHLFKRLIDPDLNFVRFIGSPCLSLFSSSFTDGGIIKMETALLPEGFLQIYSSFYINIKEDMLFMRPDPFNLHFQSPVKMIFINLLPFNKFIVFNPFLKIGD